jgi:MFS family permease
MTKRDKPTQYQQVIAAVIGNALEWYDFIVFGFMTGIISSVFFPAESAYTSLLLTTASFGVGFVMRPIGGVLIGIYADRRGRKAALQLIIGLMVLATAILTFAPPYAVIGIASSFIVVIARMLQGLATGGEFSSSTAFLIEIAPPGRQGLYASWQMVGQGLALFSGAIIGAVVTHVLSHEVLYSWGWRLPFLFGLLIGPVGFWIRRHLSETAVLDTVSDTKGPPLRMAHGLRAHGRALLSATLLTASGTIAFYVLIIYMPTFVTRHLGIAMDQAFGSQCVAILVMTIVIPFAGALSDRIGRRMLMLGALVVYFALLVPLFRRLLASPSLAHLAVVQIALCAILGVLLGPYACAVTEQFSRRIRSTGVAISYNLAVMVFGGFAQFFVTMLLHMTGSLLTPAYYLFFGAALGIIGCLFYTEQPRHVSRPVHEALEAGPQ